MTDQQQAQPQPQQAQPQQVQPLTPPPMQQAQQMQTQPPAYITFDTTPHKTMQVSPLGMQQAPVLQAQPVQQAPVLQAQQAPTPPANPYQAIIEQQKAQIDALMNQNTALSGQITQMVQNGYQVQQPQQQLQQQAPQAGQMWAVQPESVQYPPIYTGGMQQPPISLTQDVSLESLASEIGKKDGE